MKTINEVCELFKICFCISKQQSTILVENVNSETSVVLGQDMEYFANKTKEKKKEKKEKA